jgi:hypothetical protein
MLTNKELPKKEIPEKKSSSTKQSGKLVQNAKQSSISEPPNFSVKKERKHHSLLDIFLGNAIDTQDKILQAQKTTDKVLKALQDAQSSAAKINENETKKIEHLKKIKSDIDTAIEAYELVPWQVWLYQWSLVLYFVLIDIGMVIIVEFYCRWHGASFISLNIYAPANIETLSKINFVNGPTTLSIAAEVLTWSSVGVWAQQNYANTILLIKRKFRFAENTLEFVGILMRNTSVASIVIILLRISKFSIFGVSLDATNPLMFDITLGLSFLLGFFGDDAYRILKGFKDQLVRGAIPNENGNAQKDG